MAAAVQPVGLAAALDLSNGGPTLGSDKFTFTAMAAAAAAGPLVAMAYRGKGLAAISKLATVAATPVAVYTLAPGRFTASALAPAVVVTESDSALTRVLSDLKIILGVYHPYNLTKLLVKNLLVQFIMKYNRYMVAVMEHEKEAIAAEAEGRDPPPPPAMPDLQPVLERGLFTFAREVAVCTVRRVYEVLTVRGVGFQRAQPFLRDSKVWIREVLSAKHRASPLRRRLLAYAFATAHSTALFYAAEATVSVAFHTHRTLQRKQPLGNQLAFWARGLALQVLRCGCIVVATSAGAAIGSLLKPGVGTLVGHLTAEIGTSVVTGIVISSLLE